MTKLYEELIELRREIHRRPELAMTGLLTDRLVAARSVSGEDVMLS